MLPTYSIKDKKIPHRQHISETLTEIVETIAISMPLTHISMTTYFPGNPHGNRRNKRYFDALNTHINDHLLPSLSIETIKSWRVELVLST
jgi:hypothetical protein